MATPPRGRPPAKAPPPPQQRGQRALTFLGGGVLVLAVAGGAWALFGRDTTKKTETAIGPKAVTTSAPARPAGPVAPGSTPHARTSPSPTARAAASATATHPAATKSSTPAPTKAPAVKATPVPTKAPAVKPPVSSPQVGGTVAAKAYTFHIARGDTLWDLTKQVLRDTGRSTSNASVDAFVHKLYSANKATIGANPDLILVGSTISWPAGL